MAYLRLVLLGTLAGVTWLRLHRTALTENRAVVRRSIADVFDLERSGWSLGGSNLVGFHDDSPADQLYTRSRLRYTEQWIRWTLDATAPPERFSDKLEWLGLGRGQVIDTEYELTSIAEHTTEIVSRSEVTLSILNPFLWRFDTSAFRDTNPYVEWVPIAESYDGPLPIPVETIQATARANAATQQPRRSRWKVHATMAGVVAVMFVVYLSWPVIGAILWVLVLLVLVGLRLLARFDQG